MKATVLEVVEVVVDHLIDHPGQDSVYLLQQLVAGVTPLVSGCLDKPLRDDIQTMVRKLPCSGSVEE